MNESQKYAEKMRRIAQKESSVITVPQNSPANYLSPEIISSISSFKGKDRAVSEKLVVQTLLDIIINGKDNKEKMAAIDRYQKLTQSSQILLKNGSSTAAIESNNDGSTTLNIDLSSHVRSDEHIDIQDVTSRDLVAEKNNSMFGQIEDAEYEVLDD